MADRQATCPHCGMQFTYGSGRGQKRTYCGVACMREAGAEHRKATVADRPTCSMDGCTRHCRSSVSEYCEAHYYRLRRNGTMALKLDENPPPKEAGHSDGYVLEYAPGHPLKKRNVSRVYQHRRVYYDEHGEGPFDCHWCGCTVTWDDMHVDHVNAVRDDNRPSNLVASCASCNIERGRPASIAAAREKAKRYTMNGETLTVRQWAERLGISNTSIIWRLKNGWPLGRALTEGRGNTGPKRQG